MKTRFGTLSLYLTVVASAFPLTALAQDASSCSAHHAGVESRGDRVMGFDHDKTTHHFLLTPTGGIIDVTANAESDAASRDAIRTHLSHIALMFSQGDFEAPMLIHDRVVPGVPLMKQKGAAIRWTYADVPRGGRILIVTGDAEARAAIYEFLRFQIEDHQTGDTLDVTDATATVKPRG